MALSIKAKHGKVREKFEVTQQFVVELDPTDPSWETFHPPYSFLHPDFQPADFPVVYRLSRVILGTVRLTNDRCVSTDEALAATRQFGQHPDRPQVESFHRQFPDERLKQAVHAFCGPVEQSRLAHIVGHRSGRSISWHNRCDAMLGGCCFLVLLPAPIEGVPLFRPTA
jgi:hypothetical protein